jgi:hypothetical protein
LDQIREACLPLDIDIVSTSLECSSKNPLPFFFRATERTALPRRATGNDHRSPSPGKCRTRIRIANRVEPKLDEIRVIRLIRVPTQFCRRGGRHGDAKSWCEHKKSLFNRVG